MSSWAPRRVQGISDKVLNATLRVTMSLLPDRASPATRAPDMLACGGHGALARVIDGEETASRRRAEEWAADPHLCSAAPDWATPPLAQVAAEAQEGAQRGTHGGALSVLESGSGLEGVEIERSGKSGGIEGEVGQGGGAVGAAGAAGTERGGVAGGPGAGDGTEGEKEGEGKTEGGDRIEYEGAEVAAGKQRPRRTSSLPTRAAAAATPKPEPQQRRGVALSEASIDIGAKALGSDVQKHLLHHAQSMGMQGSGGGYPTTQGGLSPRVLRRFVSNVDVFAGEIV